jgi:hypothetical protein
LEKNMKATVSHSKANVSRSSYGRLVVDTKERPIGNMRRVSFDSNLTPAGVSAIIALLHDECPGVTDCQVTESRITVCFDVSRRPVEELIESMFGIIERDARQTPQPQFIDPTPGPVNNRPSYVNQPPVRSPFLTRRR